MTEIDRHGVFGTPSTELADIPAGATQVSPLMPGAERLQDYVATFASITMLAPPGTLERRHNLALALRALKPGGVLTALAPKEKGGSRIATELDAFGCDTEEHSLRHHRIIRCHRPAGKPAGLDEILVLGGLQFLEPLGLWTQPGVFSWDRIDPGSELLIEHLPALKGRGLDLGSGIGVLALAVLASPAVDALTLVDLDRRAVDAAGKNVADPRATFLWADVRTADAIPKDVDFIVMNPPFHDAGAEDKALGQTFIRRARSLLRKGGKAYLTANRHLPYEETLRTLFARVTLVAQQGGHKIFEAQA